MKFMGWSLKDVFLSFLSFFPIFCWVLIGIRWVGHRPLIFFSLLLEFYLCNFLQELFFVFNGPFYSNFTFISGKEFRVWCF